MSPTDLRFLIVDDEEAWRTGLRELLSDFFSERLSVETVENYRQALERVKSKSFDLVSVDFELLDDAQRSTEPGLEGMDLLKECRKSSRNERCALLVLSARGTAEAAYRARERYKINYFLDKHDFGDGRPYIAAVQAAIRGARIHRAEALLTNRYQLTITYDHEAALRGTLVGPNYNSEVQTSDTSAAEVDDLARRADDLNLRLAADRGAWRLEARSIGSALYQTLARNQQLVALLSTARALAANNSSGEVALRFIGAPAYLSVPYELIRDEDNYFSLAHPLTRGVSQGGPRFSTKSDQFFRFLKKQVEREEPLRILLASANSDGKIPSVEREVSVLAESIKADLKVLGIDNEITILNGGDLSFDNLREALRDGQHIFHFAGHGDFDEAVAEKSPLLLQDRRVSAADLQLLTQGTELQFVFLSCCLGAKTARQIGRGDFHGFLHALWSADVPATLAYRWNVRDAAAVELATTFYPLLWRSLSFGEALLECRKRITTGKYGRDDSTWTSPVLLTAT
jgi:CheY-like chemotaxis protein